MTKADIVNEIAKNTGIDKATVLATLEAFMGSVKESSTSIITILPPITSTGLLTQSEVRLD